nr:argininosuccinate lyase [Clostridia bacterium]
EDKEALFDAIDTVKGCLLVFTPMVATLKVKKEAMRQATKGGFANATDMADYLAKKGVPFRTAHEIVGKAVLYCTTHGKDLEDLSLAEYKDFSPVFQEDIYQTISIDECVRARKVPGGPAPEAVQAAIAKAGALLGEEF